MRISSRDHLAVRILNTSSFLQEFSRTPGIAARCVNLVATTPRRRRFHMLIHQIDSRALRGCPGAETSKAHDQPFKRASTCDLDLSPLERERLHRTLATVPNDVHNGLEIGFYDFRFTSLLRARIDLVSMDLPRKVNNTGGYKLIFADMQHLPFRAKAFDIIICTEVLEHLPEKVLIKAVEELQRVSGKYLLISVPYKQRVWNEFFKCANCSFVCNSMGHLHYMDDASCLNYLIGALQRKLNL